MKELITVIIPVYKVELYLERCVRSVLSQTYKNIEIILVDDGSPDHCGEICEKLALEDDRIKVYHKENGGLSDARNYGTERSTGKYITFIDSDDYVAPNYIEYLYDLIIKNGADISSCCMVKTENDFAEYGVNDSMPTTQLLTGKEACLLLLGDQCLTLVTAWGKLYNSDIVKKYPFPKGKKHEDEATTGKYYYESNKVAVGNKCLYAYYQNPTSIMHTQGEKINVDKIWAFEHRARFFEECGETTLSQLSWNIYYWYCVEDSIKYNGRCDKYLVGFDKGRTLSKKVKFESRFYNKSHFLYKIYKKTKDTLRSLKK